MELKYIIVGALIISNLQTVNAQFVQGGNPIGTLNTTNNYLGSNAINNTFMRFGVQGSQDIFIDNDNSKLLPADASGRLHGGHWIGMGRVFTPTNGFGAGAWAPKAHLHIDGGNNTGTFGSFGNGLRSWMNTGTLYTENSDAMYVGLRNINNFISYAVINWSDDAGGNGGSDYLSFNFTGNSGGLLGPTSTGMELGRFNPTTGRGTLGVGNFQFIGAAAEPVRRLEILDAEPSSGLNTNTPQLRTTYTYNTTPTGGVFTEFQTTSNGDMYFNTRSNTVAKNFGFHKFNPQNCVEITSHTGNLDFGNATNGSSGLRFTNLKSSNTPKPNPGTGVLSVDANGDVIYVPGGGGLTTGNNGVTVTAGAAQLGVPCSIANIPAIVANQFTTDRIIANRNQNLWIASLNNETGGMGVGGQPVLPFCNLGNTFEISANSKNTQYGTAGSGLRFTKLTSSSATIPNGTNGVNSTKVLTVDGDGDVVLTDAGGTANANNGLSTNGLTPGFIHLGQSVGAATNVGQLLDDREIPMNGKNIYFSALNQTTGIEKIQIGSNYNTNIASNSKLVVIEKVANDPVTISNGIESINADDTNSPLTEKNGIKGNSIGTNPIKGANNGGLFYANNAANFNRGVVGIAGPDPSASTAVGFQAYNGGLFIANNPTGGNIGIYAQANVTSTDLAAYFDGDVQVNGTGYITNPWSITSDQMFKNNIDTITNALNIINSLKPKQYYYDTTNSYGMRFSNKKQYGLIAQEVEQVLPEMVGNAHQKAQVDATGNTISQATDYKTVNYNALFGIMVKAIQEQQRTIEVYKQKDSIQDARLTALENAINQCCSNNSARTNNSTTNQLDVELSDKDAVVLNQNVPNPFAEQTTITYNVPVSVAKAQIIFYNGAGQIIQTVDITTRGKGKVNVFANDLSSGLYHYTLVADGKVVDSKKMVRE